MKALRLTLLVFASLLWASCEKELGPVINFTPPLVDSGAAKLIDTTYEAAVETATPKRVLIEEFTGVTCTNCPSGHQKIKGMIDANPGRISAIGYQVFNIAQANPSPETRTDNRSQKATDLGSSFGGIVFLPSATFSRTSMTPQANDLLQATPVWASMLTNRLAEPAPLNMTMTTKYVDSSRELTVTVRMAYTAEVTTKHRLTLALTEDSLIDAQEEVIGSDIITHHDYVHEHVFRDFLTLTTGDNVLDSIATKRPGRVYERAYRIKLNSAWNEKNCVVIGFIHNEDGTQKAVLQVTEKAVKP